MTDQSVSFAYVWLHREDDSRMLLCYADGAATCAFLPGASRQIARSIISWATSTLMNIESG